jgi:hypothetical protein
VVVVVVGDQIPQTTRERVEVLHGIATTLADSLKDGDEAKWMAADVLRMGLYVLLQTDLKAKEDASCR